MVVDVLDVGVIIGLHLALASAGVGVGPSVCCCWVATLPLVALTARLAARVSAPTLKLLRRAPAARLNNFIGMRSTR